MSVAWKTVVFVWIFAEAALVWDADTAIDFEKWYRQR